MNIGICTLSCIPLRAEPSDKSEMINQVLFGEDYEIISQEKKFSYIKLNYDGYEGWIGNELIAHKTEEYDGIFVNNNLITFIHNTKDNVSQIISAGSNFYKVDENLNSFILNGILYKFDGDTQFKTRNNIYEVAHIFLGVPYLWGGRTFMGIDCSGLVQIACKICANKISRDASEQISFGKTVNGLREVKKGDLAFFSNSEGNIVHVGILDGNGKILHSSGKVKIEIISEEGIVNGETGEITHKLHTIKRINQ